MNRRTTVAVIGTGREIEPAISNARGVSRSIAGKGWVLITGGRDAGVMRAANEGAKSAKESLTIGILPSNDVTISADVDVAVISDMGEARNNIIVLSADAIIACGVDGAGTASEIALAIKAGKPVVLLGASDLAKDFFAEIGEDKVFFAETADDAVEKVSALVEGT